MNKAFKQIEDELIKEMPTGDNAEYYKGLTVAWKILKDVYRDYNNGWIKCENELPDEKGYYLVTYRDGEQGIRYFCKTHVFNGWSGDLPDEIIAWQEIPKYNF